MRFISGRIVVMFLFLVAALGVGLIGEIEDIYSMWQFKSHATKSVLRSIDNTQEITVEGRRNGPSSTYTQGDYVFVTAKDVEITIKGQTISYDIMQRYMSGKPVILYYDNDSPQDIRFDGQTSSVVWVGLGCIAFVGFLFLMTKASNGKR